MKIWAQVAQRSQAVELGMPLVRGEAGLLALCFFYAMLLMVLSSFFTVCLHVYQHPTFLLHGSTWIRLPVKKGPLLLLLFEFDFRSEDLSPLWLWRFRNVQSFICTKWNTIKRVCNYLHTDNWWEHTARRNVWHICQVCLSPQTPRDLLQISGLCTTCFCFPTFPWRECLFHFSLLIYIMTI